jgi:hypothetical protein
LQSYAWRFAIAQVVFKTNFEFFGCNIFLGKGQFAGAQLYVLFDEQQQFPYPCY